jgi:hypothetical protein
MSSPISSGGSSSSPIEKIKIFKEKINSNKDLYNMNCLNSMKTSSMKKIKSILDSFEEKQTPVCDLCEEKNIYCNMSCKHGFCLNCLNDLISFGSICNKCKFNFENEIEIPNFETTTMTTTKDINVNKKNIELETPNKEIPSEEIVNRVKLEKKKNKLINRCNVQ